jgi:hypothetical protein
VLLTLSAKITGSVFVHTRTYTLAVHARTLLSYASSSSSSSPSHDPSVAVPWDAWGPPATRCFDGAAGSSSSLAATAAAVAGQRWFDRGIIRDFCPRRIRATGSRPARTERSTLAAGSVFARCVESALPYSETSLAESYDDGVPGEDAALIDGERILFFVAGNNVCEAACGNVQPYDTMTQSVNFFLPGRS